MVKPEKMARVRIVGLRDHVEKVVEELHLLGVLQIEDLSGKVEKSGGAFELGVPLENFDDVSKQLVKLRAVENVLLKAKIKKPAESFEVAQAVEQAVLLDERQLFEWNSGLESVLKQLDVLKADLVSARQLCVFEIDFSKLVDSRLSFFVGTLSRKSFAEVEGKLKRLKACQLVAKKASGGDVALLVAVENAHSLHALQILSSAGFNRLNVPEGMRRPQALVAELHAKTYGLEKSKMELEAKIIDFAENNCGKVSGLLNALEVAFERAQVSVNFGNTKNLFVLEGWIREREFAKLKHALKQATGGKALVEKTHSRELPPTSLHNSPVVSNFEDLATFVSLPKSSEFDPTIFYAFTFPIIYGMMLGDWGYGVVVLLLGLAGWLKASGAIKRFMFVLIPCGLWSIVWGAIFGEFFGFESHAVLSRVEQTPLLLGLTIAVGALHLLIGFFTGFLKEYGHRNNRHAAAKLAWIGVMIGLGLLALFSSIQVLLILGAVLLVASVAVIGWGEGLMGLVEIPGLIGNILSYMRIAAVGLASIALAVILNQFKPDLSMGLMAIPFALLFVGGHAFNIFLGIFEPFVQGSRLHFIEFYMKFYEGGGKPFAPFHVKKV